LAEQHIGVEEAAKILGLHPKTVRRLIHDGRLKAARVGRKWRIARKTLDVFLGSSTAEGSSPTPRRQAGPRTMRVSAVVNIDDIDREQDLRISSTVQAVFMADAPDREQTRYDHFYYPEEKRSQLALWGSPSFVGNMLQLLSQLVDVTGQQGQPQETQR
jgi:excisionase family DNA binding protein